MAMITDIEDFFTRGCGRCDRFDTPDCSARHWQAGLADLRRNCRDMGLVETVKWGHPCYMHGGRNVAIIGAFRGDFRLTFMNAALMKDPEGMLQKQGPNSQHPDMISFETDGQVGAQEAAIRAVTGDPDRAVELVRLYLAANPTSSFNSGSGLHWWWRNLSGRQDFQALINR
jgi:uncharacterized protein YdeI (YjbR/CyaY-like superfamily)